MKRKRNYSAFGLWAVDLMEKLNVSGADLARQFEISPATVSGILTGKIKKSVWIDEIRAFLLEQKEGEGENRKRRKRAYTEFGLWAHSMMREMRMTHAELAKHFQISPAMVNAILTGTIKKASWTDEIKTYLLEQEKQERENEKDRMESNL